MALGLPLLPGAPAAPAAAEDTTHPVDARIMEDVDCVEGTSVCVAVGTGPLGGVIVPIVDGVPGTELTVPEAGLLGVSCVAPGSCLAVGPALETSNILEQGYAVAIGVEGTAVTVNGIGAHYSPFEDVSCPPSGNCLAVGTHRLAQTGADVGDMARFDPATAELRTLRFVDPDIASVSGVSCPTPELCVLAAADAEGDGALVLVEETPGAFVSTALELVGSTMYDVDCPSPTSCYLVAFGDDIDDDRVVRVAPAFPEAPVVSATADTPRLTAISCFDEERCAAAGQTADLAGVLSFLDGTVPVDEARTVPRELRGVACWSPTECVAVGHGEAKLVTFAFTAPAITGAPTGQTVDPGDEVSFTVTATGDPEPRIQWYVTPPGGEATPVEGATSATHTFIATANDGGSRYHAVASSFFGETASSAAELRVNTAPMIVSTPVDAGAPVGTSVTFTVEVAGEPTPMVTWERAAPGSSTFEPIAGATGTALPWTVSPGDDGSRYRAVATNDLGRATSEPATLRVHTAPVVTSHPHPFRTNTGLSASFSAAASGRPEPTVQWEVSRDDGATYEPIAGATSPTLRFTTVAADHGARYRARFSNAVGTAVSQPATLILNTPPVIASPPHDATVQYGEIASFSVTVGEGDPAPVVGWQRWDPAAGDWRTIPGASGTTFRLRPRVADSGAEFRAVLTNAAGFAISEPATLTVTPAPLTVTPGPVTVGYGTTPSAFTPAVTGFVGNDDASVLTGSPACGVADPHRDVGVYTITCSGGAAADYSFSYGTSTLTVTPAPLTISPADQTRTYGEADPAFTWSARGFVPGEDASVLTAQPVCGVVDAHRDVGSYPITCTGAAADNYVITYGTGTLLVSKAELTIVAEDATRPFGAPNPPLQATLTGFVEGDTPANAVTGQAACATTAGADSPVTGSPYPTLCTQGTLDATNYRFASEIPGQLTVTAAGTTLTNAPAERHLFGLINIVSTRLTRTHDGAPLEGRMVTFSAGGLTRCTARTDADGRASCAFLGLLLWPRTWAASWAGDTDHGAASATSRL